MQIDPTTWYWFADDGRVFSGPLQATVTTSDPGYVAWTGEGNVASVWPRDEVGNQTEASMQAALPTSMFANLKYYAASVRATRAGGGVIVTSLSAVPFLSDPVSRNTVASAQAYATANAGVTVNWKMSDSTFIVLDVAQLTTLANAMAHFVEACFSCEASTAAGVDGGTITTQAQVDAAFAAVSNTYP